MKSVAIVGYGRFGKVLHRLLRDDFAITLYRRSPITDRQLFNKTTRVAQTVSEIYKNAVIFYAVPIESFAEVIAQHQKYFRDDHLLIDVLSVKMHPQRVFDKYLAGTKTQALLTHPMFGPDSSADGFSGLPLIMDRFRAKEKNLVFWKKYFESKGIRIVELCAKEHDRRAANSQGLTHFVGRMLEEFGLSPSNIDSLGTNKLLEVTKQTCNDSWQLFSNLQHYNPFTRSMRQKLGRSYQKVFAKLLPQQVEEGVVTYGIQGGKGSFNEEALLYHIHRAKIAKYKIFYLHTTQKVLTYLHEGRIDVGQFAIHNSAGGIVQESIEAMSQFTFRITEQFAIQISHALMIRPDLNFGQIDTIMTHPQVLAQCKQTLRQKYPKLKQTSGEGVLIDHALVAKKLAQHKLPKNIAVMGSKVLSRLYGLTIVEDNLQDLKENYTTFLQVRRG